MYNTTIAKLLAKENIDVQFGNYKTAWFDVKNRVLGLPMLKDMEKDVHDLFIGHEVGHALYTPFAGWHDSPEKLEGAPRSYINVTEDARIERFIQSNYPGLVGPFKRGYTKLVENGFFGDIKDVNWNKTKLIDKINVQAKLGTAISVPFNAEEIVFYKRAMTTTTFEQVVQLSKDILLYTKENQEELLNPPPPPPVPEGGPGPTCDCISFDSFGHTGFTGTIAWADPEEKIVYVFLSNRVYPDASNKKLAKMNIRTDIMEVIYEAIPSGDSLSMQSE